jgi:hypothetical protein
MTLADTADRARETLYQVGGVSAIALGVCYLVITGLYIAMGGAVPSGGGDAWFDYLDGQAAIWWAIVGISALTDLLFLPVSAALYVALRPVNQAVALIGAGLLALFAVLDLAVTQINFAALITLIDEYAATTDQAHRAAYVAAASYAAAVLDSSLFAAYAILVPGLGILALGLVMRGTFGRVTSWVAILTGIGAIVSVVGALLWSPLGTVAIFTSILTTVWVFLVGYRLVRLGQA